MKAVFGSTIRKFFFTIRSRARALKSRDGVFKAYLKRFDTKSKHSLSQNQNGETL